MRPTEAYFALAGRYLSVFDGPLYEFRAFISANTWWTLWCMTRYIILPASIFWTSRKRPLEAKYGCKVASIEDFLLVGLPCNTLFLTELSCVVALQTAQGKTESSSRRYYRSTYPLSFHKSPKIPLLPCLSHTSEPYICTIDHQTDACDLLLLFVFICRDTRHGCLAGIQCACLCAFPSHSSPSRFTTKMILSQSWTL